MCVRDTHIKPCCEQRESVLLTSRILSEGILPVKKVKQQETGSRLKADQERQTSSFS